MSPRAGSTPAQDTASRRKPVEKASAVARRERGRQVIHAAGAVATGAVLAAPWLEPALWPLSWLAMVPVMWLVQEAGSVGEATLDTFLAGLSGLLIAFHWLVETIHLFGRYSTTASAVLFVLLALYMAGQWAAFGAAARWTGVGPLMIGAPVAWVAIEYAYPNVFPYKLGAVNAPATILMQIGDLAGVYGMSFLMVWGAACAAASLRLGLGRPLVAPGIGLAAALIYGGYRMVQIPHVIAAAEPLRVALVQGNTSIERKFDPRFYLVNVSHYREASLSAQRSADLVVWPETVVQYSLPGTLKRLDSQLNPARGMSKPVLLGTHLWDPGNLGQALHHDSAILVGLEGEVWGRYDKQVLMPFGEYMPLEDVLPILKKLDVNASSYAPAHPGRVIEWPERFAIAPLICYDDLFASVAREGVRAGGELLIALNNDGWYGNTAALWQHDTLARWRTVENRRYFARCDNAGVTNVVDPLGRDVARVAPFVDGVLVARVQALRIETFYTRWGDVFAQAAIALLALFGVVRLSRTQRHRGRRRRRS